jgi:autotransporter family porin
MKLKFSKLHVMILSAFSLVANANTTFQGDTNQTSSNAPAPAYSGDIIVGNTDATGSPEVPAGTLVVDGGSQVTGNQRLVVGSGPNSSGRVTVTGNGSSLTPSQALIVGSGNAAYGELNILDGGVVTSSPSGSVAGNVGAGAGSVGIVNISGAGSAWNSSGTTNIGGSGEGTLNIQTGGTANFLRANVGSSAGSQGVINVDGGTLNITGSRSIGYIYIGVGGAGEINVTNGGRVSDSFTLLGGNGGRGALNISGAGSSFSSNLNTVAGNDTGGTGSIIVTDGGTFNASGAGLPAGGEGLILGNVSNSAGDVLVSGANSVINVIGGSIVAGKAGAGSLTLQDGGSLNTDEIIIAQQAGSEGALNIGAAADADATNAGILDPATNITFGDGSGILNFNHTDTDYVFSNLIQGNGIVEVNGGTTVLTAANTWTGSGIVNNGTLKAGAVNTLSPGASYEVASAGILDLNGFSQTLESLTNAGTINLAGSQPGTTLTVNGNYTGNGGLLVFGTALGDDTSPTDRLVVTGDTSGTSRVTVTNLGGQGAQTLNGIELISIEGNSAGEFTQQGRIVAGAWEYHLARGEGASEKNWYLSSQQEDNGGGDNPGNGGGDNPGNGGGDNPGNGGGDNPGNGGGDNPGNGGGDNPGNGGGDNPGNGGGDNPGNGGGDNPGNGNNIQVLRPEGGAYAANLYAADTMFNAPLSDRMGETEYTDTMTGERHLTSLWLKNTGGHTSLKDSSGQLKTTANRYSLMLGGDLAHGDAANGSTWRTGVLGGYGNTQSNTVSNLTGYRAKGEVSGYTTGLYGTWYGDGSSERGAYVDAMVQYSWFRNTVQGEELATERYNSSGLSATLETGYVFAMGNVNGRQDLNWYVQPKVSASWSGIKADDHREANGTEVQGDGNNNVTTRLGVKTFLKGHSTLDAGKSRNFKPFLEATWIHNSQDRGVSMDGVGISQAGTRDIGEARAGMEGRISPQWNVTGYVAQQIGDKGYSDTAAVLGVKYSF